MITERQPVRPFEQRIPLKLFLCGFLAILVSLTIDELQAQSIPEAERAALISLCETFLLSACFTRERTSSGTSSVIDASLSDAELLSDEELEMA